MLVLVGATVMAVIVAMSVLIVGAVLRIEGRLDRCEPGAEATQHVLDDMVAADAQPVADDLHVDMPVANMPGEPRQLLGVGGGDFDERLRGADNTHDGAVIEDKAVAIAQGQGVRQVEQKPGTTLAAQDDAAAMPLMRIERHGIDGIGGVPMTGGFDFARVLHDRTSLRSSARRRASDSRTRQAQVLEVMADTDMLPLASGVSGA
jgi:hypothetical protein